MLLQVIKYRLNLRSSFQEFPLASGKKLFSLFVVWWGQNVGSKCLPYLLVQRHATVASVTNGNLGMLVHELWNGPAVMDGCSRKDVSTKSTVVVDASMQLESVMLTLPVVSGVGVASGHAMVFTPHQSTDFEHSTVHEAKLRLRRKDTIQDVTNLGYDTVAMLKEVLVVRDTWEITLMVLDNPVIYLTNGLLLSGEQVEHQNGNDFAVCHGGLTATPNRWGW